MQQAIYPFRHEARLPTPNRRLAFAGLPLKRHRASWAAFGALPIVHTVEWFIAFSMCILALLKLRDVESFSNMFLGYDLLAQRFVPYAYVYPFAEALGVS
jgi:hypothetical protein